MKPGTPILGRWHVENRLASQGALDRWLLRDEGGGQAELVAPNRQVALRDPGGARARAAADLPEHPGVLPASASLVDGRAARIRARVRPWRPPARWTEAQVESALQWLVPAALAAAPALGGELELQDLVLDDDGVLRVSPSGVVRETSVVRLPRHRTQAWSADASPAALQAEALYGLGVLLFERATGTHPVQASSLGELADAQARPVAANDAAPSLSPRLAEVLDALVHPDPDVRLRAAAQVGSASPTPWTPPQSTAEAANPPVQATADASRAHAPPLGSSGIVRDVALPEWVVVYDAAASTDGARRRLAALLDVPEDTLMEPVLHAVGGGRTEADAARLADLLDRTGAPLVVAKKPEGGAPAWAALVGAMIVAASALLMPGPLALVAILASVGLLLGAKALQRRANTVDASPDALGRRWSRLKARVGEAPVSGREGEARRTLRATRRALLEADIADAMRTDLLDGVDELEAQLVALGESPSEAEVEPLIRAAGAVRTALAMRPSAAPDSTAAEGVESRAQAAARALSQQLKER